MTAKALRIQDADTGESSMDVVRVPEGYSFQIGLNAPDPEQRAFSSCIVSTVNARDLRLFLGHLQGEAYKRMQYRDSVTGEVEWLWNSRDGITPFVIHSTKGNEASHFNWGEDIYEPFRIPEVGERIFVDLSEAVARPLAVEYVNKWWEDPTYPMRNSFEPRTREEAVEQFVTSWVSEWGGHAPHVTIVTPALRAMFEKRAENKHL